MLDYTSQITDVIGSAPADLLAYYHAEVFPIYPRSRINCLPFNQAKECSQKMRGISVVNTLGLWILDDANDSNPFAYISKGPCASMVIHFSHDPEPEIAFSSLRNYLVAMHNAGARGVDIDDIPNEPISISVDSAIREFAAQGTDDATFLLTTYLPVAAALQKETKDRLISHDDFYVREAFAAYLAGKGSVEDEMLANTLAFDTHSQVARAGRAAVNAIKKKICDA
jgi:hypothetical protein